MSDESERLLVQQRMLDGIREMQKNQKEITNELSSQRVLNEKFVHSLEKLESKIETVNDKVDEIPADLRHKVAILWKTFIATCYLIGAGTVTGVGWLILKVIEK